jgi:hypothetical protein
MSKPKAKLTDMSLSPEMRGRKRQQNRIVATPPAQMSHGSNPRGRAQRRRGEKWLAVQEQLRVDAVVFADEVAGLDAESLASQVMARIAGDETGREIGNPVVITCRASQVLHGEDF